MSTDRVLFPRRARSLVALALAGLLVAACAGGDDDLVAEPTTTVEATTTSTTEATPTTEAVVAEVAPLTGLAVEDPAVLDRPALFLKVDNHPDSRPQSALDQADLVIEMLAEFGISRFAAVFHTEAPEHAGPVRSSRTSDFDLLRAFGEPLYGSSGGNDYVLGAMRDLPITNVTAFTRTEYFRDNTRRAPHNLYVDTEDLFALAPDDAGAPPAWFSYRQDGDELPASAQPATGPVTVRWGFPVSFRWDEESQGWSRTQSGQPHVVADGTQLAPANVVLLQAEYVTSRADANSPELVSTGEGDALVLTDGHLVAGRWVRPSADEPPSLVAEDGSEIALTPGQTWVLWPEEGAVTY